MSHVAQTGYSHGSLSTSSPPVSTSHTQLANLFSILRNYLLCVYMYMHLHKTKKMKKQLMEVSSPPMVPGPKLRRSDLAASDDNLASPQVSDQLSSRALQSLVKRQTAPLPSSQDSAYPQGFRLLVNFLSLPSFAVISNFSLSPLSPAP